MKVVTINKAIKLITNFLITIATIWDDIYFLFGDL